MSTVTSELLVGGWQHLHNSLSARLGTRGPEMQDGFGAK